MGEGVVGTFSQIWVAALKLARVEDAKGRPTQIGEMLYRRFCNLSGDAKITRSGGRWAAPPMQTGGDVAGAFLKPGE